MGKLEEVGSRLGLINEDIKSIRKRRRVWGLFIGLGGIILALFIYLLGLILGLFTSGNDTTSSSDGYPFAVSAFGIGRMNGRRIWKWQMPALFGLGFLTGISRPVFGNGTYYGVYGKE